MARYFLHLRDGTDELLDPEGIEMLDDAIAGIALASARDCIAHDVQRGEIKLSYRIDVHDAGGTVVHSLSFADAVTITH